MFHHFIWNYHLCTCKTIVKKLIIVIFIRFNFILVDIQTSNDAVTFDSSHQVSITIVLSLFIVIWVLFNSKIWAFLVRTTHKNYIQKVHFNRFNLKETKWYVMCIFLNSTVVSYCGTFAFFFRKTTRNVWPNTTGIM